MRGVFDIVGPIMIGPSSSHTAGAVRLARLARNILGEAPRQAVITLHGSFAQTGAGHGTDKALAAGLLGFAADDARIRDALTLAQQQGLHITFATADLGDVHPNTAALRLTGQSGRTATVVGSSIGGGNVVVTNIDGYDVELTGDYQTLFTVHHDQPGVIAAVTAILARQVVNIAFMRVSRKARGAQALMLLEADNHIPAAVLAAVQQLPAVEKAVLIPPL